MIPFSLFKYIFFRGILYGIVYSIIYCLLIIVGICTLVLVPLIFIGAKNIRSLISNNIHFNEYTILTLLCIILFLFFIVTTFYVSKLILNKMIFKEYKRIKIDTSMRSISNKFTMLYILYTVLISAICNTLLEIIVYMLKDISQFFHCKLENSIKISLLLNIMAIIIYYTIENIFLEKYISVSWKESLEIKK